MKYFAITTNINFQEVGIYPQVVRSSYFQDIQQSGFGWEGPIQGSFILPEMLLQNRARPTTNLSVTSINGAVLLVLKNHFMNFLKDFDMGEWNSWGINVFHKKQLINDYSLFHLSYPSEQTIIDFKASVFEINDDWLTRATTGELITFPDYETYDKVRNQYRGPEFLLANKLVLDFSNQKHDLIRLLAMPMTGSGYYVSERLKNAIEEHKFTGFAFKEIEEMSRWIKCVF